MLRSGCISVNRSCKIALDKVFFCFVFSTKKYSCFSYFMKMYSLGSHQKCLAKGLTHNICVWRNKKKIFIWILNISGAILYTLWEGIC